MATELSVKQLSQRRLSITGIIVGALTATVGTLAVAYILVTSHGCPPDGRFTEITEGDSQTPLEYQWERDSDNYCRWTLWDTEGNAAPEAAYPEPGSIYPGPTPRPLTVFYVGIGVGIAVMLAGIVGIRRTRRLGSRLPEPTSTPDARGYGA